MISETLKLDIEHYAAHLRGSNPLLLQARNGCVTPDAIATYLNSVLYLVQQTPVCLSRARDRARALGEESLAEYFEHKLEEEVGHDQWAQSDIELIETGFKVKARQVVPAIGELVNYLLDVIDTRPVHYVAYILFVEYLTVLLGPEWINALADHCGIPPQAMTVISRHAELDKEHAAECLQHLNTLLGKHVGLQELRATLSASMEYFSKFTQQISGLSN